MPILARKPSKYRVTSPGDRNHGIKRFTDAWFALLVRFRFHIRDAFVLYTFLCRVIQDQQLKN